MSDSRSIADVLLRLADAGVDPVTFGIARIVGQATVDLAELDEWVMPTQVCYLLRDGDLISMRPLPMPELHGGAHPVDLLQLITRAMGDIDAYLLGLDIVGWSLISEGYMLRVDTRDADSLAAADAAVSARTIHTQPDRIECRLLTAVDRAGRTYQSVTGRGESPVLAVTLDEHDDDEAALSGRVLDALRKLMDTTPIGGAS